MFISLYMERPTAYPERCLGILTWEIHVLFHVVLKYCLYLLVSWSISILKLFTFNRLCINVQVAHMYSICCFYSIIYLRVIHFREVSIMDIQKFKAESSSKTIYDPKSILLKFMGSKYILFMESLVST